MKPAVAPSDTPRHLFVGWFFRFQRGLLLTALVIWVVPGLAEPGAADATAEEVELWHTFGVGSRNEKILEDAVAAFERVNPEIDVQLTRIPYDQNLPQFINASQGGEAPDLIRVSDSELGKIGHISVEGLPLLEDLRPHLTPAQRSRFESRALQALRYGDALYAVPVSQDCMALVYNKDLFDAAGLAYPTDEWTTDDMIRAAAALTAGNVKGMSIPMRWSYWFLPFLNGFGGSLFDEYGQPTLNSPGSAEAMNWYIGLYRGHGIVAPGVDIETMSTQFMQGRAAMIFDGPWNLGKYQAAGLDLGIALMPVQTETGLRLRPMFSYFGWAMSKQSAVKVAAVRLALWLSRDGVQKEFALASYTMPVAPAVWELPEIAGDAFLQAYLRQTKYGFQYPTIRATSMAFEQLDTAMEMTYTGKMTAQQALDAANRTLHRMLAQ